MTGESTFEKQDRDDIFCPNENHDIFQNFSDNMQGVSDSQKFCHKQGIWPVVYVSQILSRVPKYKNR